VELGNVSWYLYVRKKLFDGCEFTTDGYVISLMNARKILGISLHIPKELQGTIISELVVFGLVERVSHCKLRVVELRSPGSAGLVG